MKQNAWEANNNSASQEIPRPLWNPKFYYHVNNSPPLVPIPSQMHPVHIFPPYFPKIHSNIIIPSTPWSSEWSLPFKFSKQNFVRMSHFSHACYMFASNNFRWSVKLWSLLQSHQNNKVTTIKTDILFMDAMIMIHLVENYFTLFTSNLVHPRNKLG